MKKLLILILMVTSQTYAEERETIHLWPDEVPGESQAKAAPVFFAERKGNVTRIRRVTDPILEVYEANPENANGVAVIICPGGGYGRLAIDKEGYEVADWLSDLGYTAFVLQYRVPKKEEGALQDAVRAIRCVRGMCKKWNVAPNKIGIMGFSAGGSLGARLSTRYNEVLYEPFDRFDKQSARPDFAVLIYPAFLDRGPEKSLTPELKVNRRTPPMFLFGTADDPYVNSSVVFSAALMAAKVPVDFHMLAKGGHGYGMRQDERVERSRAAGAWPGLCKEWLDVTVLQASDRKSR